MKTVTLTFPIYEIMNCFTHRYTGEPIPPRSNYVAASTTPRKTKRGAEISLTTSAAKKYQDAVAFNRSQISIGTKADADKRSANLKARI